MLTCGKIAVLCCTLYHFVLSVPTTTVPPGCVRDGKHYAVQESFQPSPCEHCMCSTSGEVVCAIADCFITPCVDAVHDPTKCCPVCPNEQKYVVKVLIVDITVDDVTTLQIFTTVAGAGNFKNTDSAPCSVQLLDTNGYLLQGPNCMIHGQIVPAGQTVQIDNSVCSCPDNLHLHFGIGAGLPLCSRLSSLLPVS